MDARLRRQRKKYRPMAWCVITGKNKDAGGLAGLPWSRDAHGDIRLAPAQTFVSENKKGR